MSGRIYSPGGSLARHPYTGATYTSPRGIRTIPAAVRCPECGATTGIEVTTMGGPADKRDRNEARCGCGHRGNAGDWRQIADLIGRQDRARAALNGDDE